jgi:hypothetical protein
VALAEPALTQRPLVFESPSFPGEDAPLGAIHQSVDEIYTRSEVSSSVRLNVPLEDLGDAWPVLRALWERVAPDGMLTVRYGARRDFRLASKDVSALLRLAGFSPAGSLRSTDERQITARRYPRQASPLSCTVVVPCRNEVDNVDNLVARVPAMGTHTELIFVDGSSDDGTPERIEELIAANPGRDIKLLRQDGRSGKAGATFQGFAAAQCDVVMILDADMTVRPEDLPRFYLAVAEGVADFANGTRLIYPMEHGAMPALNNIGNKAFGVYMSWVLGSHVTDTLCGTKAMLKRDIPAVLEARPVFGGHDPWGDFDLLMGAAYEGLRIVDVPIRYVARTAGESKMRPMAHGLSLAKTSLIGARRLKFGRRGARAGRA